jgi:hypothetical protein
MQHSLPLAQIGPQFGFGPELGRWEKADRRRIDGTCLALAAVGTEGDTETGFGIGAGILRIDRTGIAERRPQANLAFQLERRQGNGRRRNFPGRNSPW